MAETKKTSKNTTKSNNTSKSGNASKRAGSDKVNSGTKKSTGTRKTATGVKASVKSTGKSDTGSKKTAARTEFKSDNELKQGLSNEQLQLQFEKNVRFKNEIILIATIVISLILFLSNFKMTGFVGAFINGVFFGLFGWLAYLMPFFFVLIAVLYVVSTRKDMTTTFLTKLIPSIIICMLFAGMIQLAIGDNLKDMAITDYYKFARENKTGGGFFGGILCAVLAPAFGRIGSFIIFAALEIICLMFITGKAIVQSIGELIRKDSKKIYHHQKEKHELNKELREQRRLEEAERYEQLGLKNIKPIPEESYNNSGKDGIIGNDKRHKIISFILGETDYNQEEDVAEEKEEKKNFFGGKTPVKVYDPNNDLGKEFVEIKTEKGIQIVDSSTGEIISESNNEMPVNNQSVTEEKLSKEDEKLVYNGEYFMSKENMQAVNSLYEDEMLKKFGANTENSIPLTGYQKPAEVKQVNLSAGNSHNYEILTDDEKQEIDAETLREYGENAESFSETALRDRQNGLSQKVTKTIFDQKPYGGVGAVKPVKAESNEVKATDTPSVSATSTTVAEMKKSEPVKPEPPKYVFPSLKLLKDGPAPKSSNSYLDELETTALKLQQTLDSFGVKVKVTNKTRGPAVTRYELTPEQGVKVSRITNLADDIKLNLAAADIRIEAPIPGKPAVGIEVPNQENTMVALKDLIASREFDKDNHAKSNLTFTVGKDIAGNNIIGDIAKMPHLLIAGSTGSGKSVCINTIIMSLLYRAHPDDVKLIMIDPKVVELSVYNGIPHLLIPVVTDPKKAAGALNWAVQEMEERYNKFAQLSVRDLKGYNERVRQEEAAGNVDDKYPIMPQIVVIVDEMADLMMVASNEVEDAICRLAQKSRACGIHLILATQRPSVNVITGLIKANVPSRIAFAVSSGVDSRTILDTVGAEKLLGKGDMLYSPSGLPKPIRVQGAFVSDNEVNAVVDFLKSQTEVKYSDEVSSKIETAAIESKKNGTTAVDEVAQDGRDEFFAEAGRLAVSTPKPSIGMLQRKYKIGFNRAARIMDQLAEAGAVTRDEGNGKPRSVLMTPEQFEQFLSEQN